MRSIVLGDTFEEFRKKLNPMRSIDHAGEVAEYMMILTLNELGKKIGLSQASLEQLNNDSSKNSNNSLSMFDELRSALNIHYEKNIIKFSKTLLDAATNGGAKALGYEKSKGKDSEK